MFWKFAERISAQLVTLVVSIILARLLEPTHYGIIAIVNIFITLANVFVSDGVASALIQKKDVDSLDYSSILIFNIVFSIIIYLVLFFMAPIISVFYGYGYEILTPVLRVLSLRIILSAINSVQQAYVSRQMVFKKFFWSTLLGTIVSAVVGVTMAYCNFGVWSLVAQYLINTIVGTIILGISLGKIFPLKFSLERVKILLPFGIQILGSNLLITGYQEMRAMIIGKIYSSSDLAYYDQGKKFPNLIVTNINTSIGAVLFPKMASEQDDIAQLKNITRKSISFSAFIMCPMLLGLAVVAEPFVKIVLTEKWMLCVPLLKMFCIIYLFHPIHTANMQAIKAIGRSDIYLKLEATKKIMELVVLLITMWISVEAITVGMMILTTMFTFVNAYPNIKLINYSFREQMEDLLPSLLKALIMVVIILCVGKINFSLMPMLCIQICLGVAIYLYICYITKTPELFYILQMIKLYLMRK